MIQTRTAAAGDVEFARALHDAAYREVVIAQFGAWDEARQDAMFLAKWDPSKIQIIEFDGVAVGCIAIEDRGDHMFLSEIQLLPRFQGKGIGSQVVRREMESAVLQKKALRLQVLQKNQRATQLYERLGFATYGKTERHFLMEYDVGRSGT